MQRGLVMISCNGASLGYGFAEPQPLPEDPPAGSTIPRANQLPAIPAEPETPTIFCGPEAK